MSIASKKMAIADKMYKQNSTGGLGKSPKNYQNGKEKGELKMKYKQNGETTGFGKGQKFSGSNKEGKFGSAKYSQSNSDGSIKGGYKMSNC